LDPKRVIKYYPDSIRVLGTAGNEMWAAGEWSITIQGQSGPMQFHGYWGAVKAREGDTWKTRLDVSNTAPRPAATAATPSPTTTPSNKYYPNPRGDRLEPRASTVPQTGNSEIFV
jgi:hypothetical protein